jgi:hypothetical protein
MSKIVCIYSLERDHTTDFLQSLCDHINATLFAVQIGYDVDSEDDTIEEIYNAVEKADTVLFLAGQDFITGENIVVDGGRSLGPSHR